MTRRDRGSSLAEGEAERLRRETRLKTRVLHLLGRITSRHNVDDMCRATVEGVRELLGFERAGLFLFDPETRIFRGTFGTGLDGRTKDEHQLVMDVLPGAPEERIVNGSAIERGCNLGEPVAQPGEEGVKADLIGLRVDGKLFGILSVDNRMSRRPITDEELSHLALISQVLGNMLETSRARLALARSEERFRQVADNSGEWIWEIHPDRRYSYASPVVQAILGYAPEEVCGTRMEEWFSEADREAAVAQISTALAEGQPIPRFVIPHRHREGYEVMLETSGIAVRNETGEVVCYRGAHRDVTRERDLEAQLRHSQKIDAIGRLAGGIAHDFNNLLTAILGCGSLLLEEVQENDPVREDIERIRTAGERAAALTRQLLAFSRRQVLHVEDLDINEVVREMQSLLQRTIGEDIELITKLGTAVPRIESDADQIQQIILHLALNARDAMGDPNYLFRSNEIRQEVSSARAGKERKPKQLIIETQGAELDAAFCRKHVGVSSGLHAVLKISDTGVGMPREVRAHLFEPFFTTREVGRGSGLGLSTVYGIVKQMGGHIAVDSVLGEGTTFTIYLPLKAGKPAGKPPPKKEEKALQGKETILIVEDEEVVRNLTVRMLHTLGYQTLQARHGVEALEVCNTHKDPIHLVLTDMIMPQMNGKEFVEKLRKQGNKSKILFVSGYSSEDTVGGKTIGVDTPLIQKPFTREQLAAKIREVLDRH